MFADWNEISSLLNRADRAPGTRLPDGIGALEAERLRSLLGDEVPTDLLNWLQIANGPCVGAGGLFGFGTSKHHLDIAFLWGLFPEWRQNGWIPVAGDGCGNYYLLVNNDKHRKSNPVIFVDTFDESDSGAYLVASSLCHFLRFYLETDIQKTKWPFGEAYVVGRDPAILNFHDFTLPWEA
jgi:hypothetical protein